MAEPFLAEIRLVGFNFAPRGWARCDGQILPINQNQSLFSLLGTTYGGDGRTSFGLPDLRGRTPIHAGSGPGVPHPLGHRSGVESVVLSQGELPAHRHAYNATCEVATSTDPADAKLAPTAFPAYRGNANTSALHPASIVETGGGAPHNNMQPYLAVNFVIALQGVFPSR